MRHDNHHLDNLGQWVPDDKPLGGSLVDAELVWGCAVLAFIVLNVLAVVLG